MYDSLQNSNNHDVEDKKQLFSQFIKCAYDEEMKDNVEDLICEWESVEDRPIQFNDVDCGMFMLMYAKCLALNLNMSFSQEGMQSYRKQIKIEIENEEIRNLSNVKDDESLTVEKNCFTKSIHEVNVDTVKTESLVDLEEIDLIKSKKSPEYEKTKEDCIQRVRGPPKFTNSCLTICWLNSLLQFFCLLFEYTNITEYHRKSNFVKMISDFKEKRGPNNADLFRIFLTKNNQTLRKNQQDPMDFFSVIYSHKLSDYFPLLEPLKIVQKSWTFCLENSDHVSETPFTSTDYIEVEKPVGTNGLKNVIEKHFQGGDVAKDWKCPVANCGKGGLTKRQLSTEKPNFLLVRVARWEYDRESGIYRKNNDSIDVTETVTVSDIFDGSETRFDIIGIINHKGDSIERGHYISEIKMAGQWWKCNDEIISPISFNQLDVNGYIFLFKKR